MSLHRLRQISLVVATGCGLLACSPLPPEIANQPQDKNGTFPGLIPVQNVSAQFETTQADLEETRDSLEARGNRLRGRAAALGNDADQQ